MAIGNMLAGVGGFFEGWKSMDELINSHQKMLARQEQIEGYQTGKALADQEAKDLEDYRKTTGQDSYGGGGDTDATTGSSTPKGVPPGAEVPEYAASRSSTRPSEEVAGLINKAAEKYKIDPVVLTGLLSVESSFNPKAVSPAGAQGIAQLMPGTAAGLGVKDPFDVTQAIPAAAQYLRQGLDAHGGDINKALMYYHGGPDTRQWGPITRAYPGAVLGRARQFGTGYDPSAYPASTPAPAAAPSALGVTTDTPAARAAVPPATGPVVATAAIPPPEAANRITVPPPSALNVSPAPAPIPPRVTGKGVMPPGGLVTPDDYARYTGKTAGSGGGTPQMPGYGAGGNNPYNTQLQPTQEAAFRAWVKNNKVKFNPDADMTDYDMRGFWSAMQQGDPRAQTSLNPDLNEVHYPDFWKTPIHKTFSNESQYAPPGAPRWSDGQLISNDGNVLVDERANALGR